MFKKVMILGLSAIIIFTFSACREVDVTKEEGATPVTSSNNDTETDNQIDLETEIVLPDMPLQKGDQGEEVESLQLALKKLEYPIEATGHYDKKTTWAMTDFQLQLDDLSVTGMYNETTKRAIEEQLNNKSTIQPGVGLAFKEDSVTKDKKTVTGNPYDVLVLVNKEHALPENFIPEDLVNPDVRFPFTEDLPKKQMRKVAAEALERLFAAADQDSIELFAQSGFRSYGRQENIFAANVEKNGEKVANKYSARPGESEHQTGLTMDVTSADIGFDLIIEFGETPEGQWLEKHVSDYGFIIRYPEGKEKVTGYQYEPWHLRYVGEKAAQEIMGNGITLEEYLDEL